MFEWMYDRRSELYIDIMCVLLIAVYAVPSGSVWEKIVLTSVFVPFALFVARGLKLRRLRRRNPLPDGVDFRIFIKKNAVESILAVVFTLLWLFSLAMPIWTGRGPVMWIMVFLLSALTVAIAAVPAGDSARQR